MDPNSSALERSKITIKHEMQGKEIVVEVTSDINQIKIDDAW